MARRRKASSGLPVGAWAGIVAGSIIVVGVAVWLIVQPRGDDAPIETAPSPTPSVTPSPSSSPVTEAPLDLLDRVPEQDREILERLLNPTTGEVWHEPAFLETPPFATDIGPFYAVGTRGDAQIIALVADFLDPTHFGYAVEALIEVDSNGVRFIACPSAHPEAECMTQRDWWFTSPVTEDTATHYDTLTFPTAFFLDDQTRVDTTEANRILGHAGWWPVHDFEDYEREHMWLNNPTTVLELGQARIITTTNPGLSEDVTLSVYQLITPLGSAIVAPWDTSMDTNYGVGTVTWNDGLETFTHTMTDDGPERTMTFPVVPAAQYCSQADEAIIDAIPSTWEVAGRTTTGADVYLPTSADDPVLIEVFEYMLGATHEMAYRPYPHSSAQELLESRGLFAWERYDGRWALAMSKYSLNTIYECS